MEADANATPWIRLYQEKAGTRRVTAFRFQGSAPEWFTDPDAKGWTPPSRPMPADPFWMPPPPPLGSFGKPAKVTAVETVSYETLDDLPTFKAKLRNYQGPNPVDDLPK